MTAFPRTRSFARCLVIGVGAAASAYGAYAAVTWFRYGRPSRSAATEDDDPLLDRFMPIYDVAERHHMRVSAPAEMTLAAAGKADLLQSRIARLIFRAREVILGSEPDREARPRGLLELTQSIGWRVLARVPGREVVVGAVTQPWKANVTFHGLSPDEFAAFNKPGYVKIAWTLRADPITPTESVFRTETRAIATVPSARAKFRWYWSFLSPGILAIRSLMLQPVKMEAERGARNETLELICSGLGHSTSLATMRTISPDVRKPSRMPRMPGGAGPSCRAVLRSSRVRPLLEYLPTREFMRKEVPHVDEHRDDQGRAGGIRPQNASRLRSPLRTGMGTV